MLPTVRRAFAPAALTLALALSVFASGCDPLDHSELRREVDTIGSVATEGGLLADDVARDRTKATFVRVHAGELADTVDESAEKLNDATPQAGLKNDVEHAMVLASEASQALGTLEESPGDEQQAKQARDELGKVSRAAGRLADSL
jgi:hypothetical protein